MAALALACKPVGGRGTRELSALCRDASSQPFPFRTNCTSCTTRTCGVVILLPQVASPLVLRHNVGHQVVPQLAVQLLGARSVWARRGAVVPQRLVGGWGADVVRSGLGYQKGALRAL